jgi:hypothetical protein
MEKKARLAGFDDARVQNLYRQHARALALKRKLRTRDLGQWEELAIALLDRQMNCRDRICDSEPADRPVGPKILQALREHLAPLNSSSLNRK